MNLAELETELSRNLEDRRYWAVYADALDLAQQPERAGAIRRALAEGASLPDPEGEPAHQEADWHFGHWRALWMNKKGFSRALTAALEHDRARFLEQLVLGPQASLEPLKTARLPPRLVRLDLLGSRKIDLSALGPLFDGLQTLFAPGISVRELRPSPSLAHLALERFQEPPPAPMARLEVLALGRAPSVELLQPALFPALHTLCLRETLRAERLEALLSSPIAGQLRRLELTGTPGLLSFLEATLPRWEGLERIVVDLDTDEAPRVGRGRLQVRTRARELLGAEETRYLRLAPPAGALRLYRGLREICLELDLRLEFEPEPWLAVPRRLAAPLARFLASRCGAPAQVLEVVQHIQGSRADLEVRATEFSPDGFESPADLDLTRTELSYDDEREGDDNEMGEEELYEVAREMVAELFSHTTVGEPRFWVPTSFRPDPWTLGRPACAPRRLVRAGSALVLEGEVGPYLAFRARAAGALQRCPLPDLSRWTERLLRRHQLEREPDDPSHPFWADWEQRTRPERAARSDPDKIPHYKLLARGRWLLPPEEGVLLCSALRYPIEHHRVPEALAKSFRQAVGWLEGGGEIEVEVE